MSATTATPQYNEVLGWVSRVIQTRRDEPGVFFLRVADGVEYRCTCSFFCPVEESDTVFGVVSQASDTSLTFVRQPFVQLPVSEDAVKMAFIRALRGSSFGEISATNLYSKLAEQAKLCNYTKLKRKKLAEKKEPLPLPLPEGPSTAPAEGASNSVETERELLDQIKSGPDGVIAYLSEVAAQYHKTKSPSIIEGLVLATNLKVNQGEALLKWWHQKRSIRRLHLLGLTNKEIKDAQKNLDEIYEICLINPFRLPSISIEKAETIMRSMRKEPSAVEIACGQIVRKIFSLTEMQGWTCTPLWILTKQFPNFHHLKELLISEYEITFEYNSAYLQYPYRVESFVAQYLDRKIKRTATALRDLPQASTPQLESSFYFCKTLTDEQKLAIRGALTHDISIITGGAGTGKCLGPETPILTAYGGIKLAKEIEVGDLLIGDDSTCRTVLSVCEGEDNMYEIIPIKGRSFICNEPHILTLKGIVPQRSTRRDRTNQHIVRYTVRGHRKNKAFVTAELADAFAESLPEDIFDIPLNEYMKQGVTFKRETYLFHVGVNFNSQEVPFDPYMIGYWLGDGTANGPQITTVEPEIIEYFTEVLVQYELELHQCKGKDISYNIVGSSDNYIKTGGNPMINTLRDLNLLSNKHIPNVYKLNSREVRLKLLAGLIDSDGHYTNNCLEISQVSNKLSDDIEYLAFSLGFMVTRTKSKKGCMLNGIMREGYYNRISIFGEGLEEIPVLLVRKMCSFRKQPKRATCISFEVKPLGKGKYHGFTIDGNGRFLLGDFKVTHNTIVINEIIKNLQAREISFVAAAFTGKAVSRLQEVLKCRLAATMDRLIMKAAQIPPFKVLLLDEGSMITGELFYRFIKAFPFEFKVILVGDINQLAPIGWSTLMQQMKASKRVPTYVLNINHRIIQHTVDDNPTGEASLLNAPSPGEVSFDRIILENANFLIAPRDLGNPLTFRQGTGFYLVPGDHNTIYTIVQSLADAGIDYSQITVISPYNEYLAQLNTIFQTIFLQGAKKMMDPTQRLWCVGDRVMLLVNNYDIGVYNGEEGIVSDLTDAGVVVRFKDGADNLFLYQGKNKKYRSENKRAGGKNTEAFDNGEWEEQEMTIEHIQHSFAVTCHKSQGSEQMYVIIYVPQKGGFANSSSFLNINLLYTAITRTKRAVWLVGSEHAIDQATCRAQPRRYENLCARLIASRDSDLEAPLNKLADPELKEVEGKENSEPYEEDLQHEDFGSYE